MTRYRLPNVYAMLAMRAFLQNASWRCLIRRHGQKDYTFETDAPLNVVVMFAGDIGEDVQEVVS